MVSIDQAAVEVRSLSLSVPRSVISSRGHVFHNGATERPIGSNRGPRALGLLRRMDGNRALVRQILLPALSRTTSLSIRLVFS